MFAVYARVSGEEQAQKGYSLGDQVSSGKALAGDNPCKEYIDDGYSGEFLERPALDRLRDDVRAGLIDTVIMYDPDRMSRNLTNQLILADEFEKYHVKLNFITGNYDASPEGKLFFSMKGAVSAYEKGKIKERTNRGKRKKVLSNRILQPNTPYGYDWDNENQTYIINKSEAKIVRYIYEQYNKRIGPLEIVKNLLANGIKTRSGKQFSPNMIWRIVSNERYSGIAWQLVTKTTKISQYKSIQEKRPKDQQIAVTVPSIITSDTYIKARQIAEENKKLSSRNQKQDYMLHGVLFCKVCGHAMTGIPVRVGKYSYRYYMCNKNKNSFYFNDRCNSKRINADEIETQVWEKIKSMSSKNEFILPSKEAPDNINDLESKIQELSKKRKQLVKWYKDGWIEVSEAETELKNIHQQTTILTEKLKLERINKNKKVPAKISLEQIKNAVSIKDKNRLLLNSGIKIKAIREGKQVKIDFI